MRVKLKSLQKCSVVIKVFLPNSLGAFPAWKATFLTLGWLVAIRSGPQRLWSSSAAARCWTCFLTFPTPCYGTRSPGAFWSPALLESVDRWPLAIPETQIPGGSRPARNPPFVGVVHGVRTLHPRAVCRSQPAPARASMLDLRADRR